jgi:hypothetical protein
VDMVERVAQRFGIKPQPARPACGRLFSIGPLRSRYFKTLLNSGAEILNALKGFASRKKSRPASNHRRSFIQF